MSEKTVKPWDECADCDGYQGCIHSGMVYVTDEKGGTSARFCDNRVKYETERRAESILASAKLTPRFRSRRFDNFETSTKERRVALSVCRKWADGLPGRDVGLTLSGTFGTGKTHLAAAMVNHALSIGMGALFVVVGDMIAELRDSMDSGGPEKKIGEIAKVPLLVLDDLGAFDAKSEWQVMTVFRIVNARYESLLPTVITTNLDQKQLALSLGGRTFDRLVEMTDWLSVGGESYRSKISMERRAG